MDPVVLYERHDAVALISLNRPDSLNGFTPQLTSELSLALEKAGNDDDVRVIVLTGEGRCFSTGADLKQGFREDRTTEGMLQFEYRPALEAIARIPKPVIAAVPGFAAGIGLSFALQADLMIMADDAFLLAPFSTISLVPDGGQNWLLVRRVGYQRAYQMAIEAERVGADDCHKWGIANKVVPAAELRDAALDWARRLAERAPLAMAATKKVMRLAMDSDWGVCYDTEARLQNELRETDDSKEGVDAFFEKRKPQFKGK